MLANSERHDNKERHADSERHAVSDGHANSERHANGKRHEKREACGLHLKTSTRFSMSMKTTEASLEHAASSPSIESDGMNVTCHVRQRYYTNYYTTYYTTYYTSYYTTYYIN